MTNPTKRKKIWDWNIIGIKIRYTKIVSLFHYIRFYMSFSLNRFPSKIVIRNMVITNNIAFNKCIPFSFEWCGESYDVFRQCKTKCVMGTGYVLYFKRISICKGMWVAYLKGLIYIDATKGSYILLRCVQAYNIHWCRSKNLWKDNLLTWEYDSVGKRINSHKLDTIWKRI